MWKGEPTGMVVSAGGALPLVVPLVDELDPLVVPLVDGLDPLVVFLVETFASRS